MSKVLVETSARHIHVSKEALEALFGVGYELKKKKELFDNTQDIIQSIKYGEIIFQKVMQEIPSERRG